MSDSVVLAVVVAFFVSMVGLVGWLIYDSIYGYHGPSPEEIQNLRNALPEGCVAHDVGTYGKIDNMVVIECAGKDVTASYTYMYERHGKTSETDRAVTYVIQ